MAAAADESPAVPRQAPAHTLRFGLLRRLPMLHQGQQAECAVACVAMVSSYYGRRIGIAELRKRFQVSLRGSSLAALLHMAGACELSARPLRAELSELRRLRTPAILHWRFDHFVVLEKAGLRSVRIHDPAVGARRLSWQRVSDAYTGVAVELLPADSWTPRSPPAGLRLADFWSRARGLGPALLQMFCLSALLQALTLLAPLVNQVVVDEAIAKADLQLLAAILLGFGVLVASQALVEALRSATGLYLGQMLNYQLRSNLLRHLLRLPLDFFEQRHIGDIVSRFGSLAPIQQLITSAVVTVLLDGILCLATLAVMFVYSPSMALLVLATVALGFVARLASFPWVRRRTQEQIAQDAELQSVFLESVRAVRPLKMFARESERHSQWQNAFVDTANTGIRLQRFGIAAGIGQRLLAGAQDAAIFYAGARAVLAGQLTLGMFFAFQAYRAQFSRALGELVGQYFAFRTAAVHRARLEDIVHAAPEAAGHLVPGATPLRGGLGIDNLSFRFGDDQPWIITGAEIEIRPGERIGLIGPSGGGKSTLLKLMLGLYPPTHGAIRYDGLPLTALDLVWFRRQVGVVMQDDRLLSGTLADNIAFFDDAAEYPRIVKAARLACLHEEILAMPMAYDTLVGDMGSSLSGGQVQRLLLARALYAEPRLLFLDEGTANLDSVTEQRVLDSLRTLPCTQIIVAHRSAAIAACDRVFRVADCRLVEVPKPA